MQCVVLIDTVNTSFNDIAFQRMYYEREYSGTGIGLAVARKSVESMGAHIGLGSAPGTGSSILLSFRPSRPSGFLSTMVTFATISYATLRAFP